MDTLNFLGIYEGDLNTVVEMCEECLDKFEVSRDGWDENFTEHLENYGRWDNITETIINAYLETTAAFLEDKYPELNISWENNGMASQLFINGEAYTSESVKGDFIKDFEVVYGAYTDRVDLADVLTYSDIVHLEECVNAFLENVDNSGDIKVEITAAYEQFTIDYPTARDNTDFIETFEMFAEYPDEEDNRAVFEIIANTDGKESTSYITIDDLLAGYDLSTEIDNAELIVHIEDVVSDKIQSVKAEISKDKQEMEKE